MFGTVVMKLPFGMRITAEGVFLQPDLTGYQTSIIGKWWTRPSLILPGIGGLSRKEVVLGLVNKEGDAHVDSEVSERYLRLMECRSLQVGTGDRVSAVNVARLLAGQAGAELLDSLERNFEGPFNGRHVFCAEISSQDLPTPPGSTASPRNPALSVAGCRFWRGGGKVPVLCAPNPSGRW